MTLPLDVWAFDLALVFLFLGVLFGLAVATDLMLEHLEKRKARRWRL